MYNVDSGLRRYLVGDTVAPESIITTPYDANQIKLGSLPDRFDSGLEVACSIEIINYTPNPKWLRDDVRVGIKTLGADASKYLQSRDLIFNIFNELLGGPNLYIEDSVYFQFTSGNAPTFVGYREDSKPLFSATLDFVVDGKNDLFNRKALC